MKAFLRGSPAEKGTLMYLKNRYNHRNASTEVMTCFTHVENLLYFATKGMIIAKACDMLGLNDLDAAPQTLPDLQQVQHVASHIVDTVWSGPTMRDITAVLDAFPEGKTWDTDWCLCGEGRCFVICSWSFYYHMKQSNVSRSNTISAILIRKVNSYR